MINYINLTKARNTFSQVINRVSDNRETYVVIRDSQPKAVVIPWELYSNQEKNWQSEFDDFMSEGKKLFKKWLKKKGLKPKNENEVYDIINKVAGRD